MQCISFVLASVLAIADSTSVNYCGARMCRNTNAHTFCQFPEGPSPHCVGHISVRLTIEEKARVLARLNRRRNEAASGNMRGLPSAGNMLKLRWVEELAREAQRWADQCRPPRSLEEHDLCRDLYSISVGQCVASVVGEAPGLRIESMVDIWYMQSMLYKGNVTFYMPPSQNNSFYGDFAQIIWARSYMVGCGRSRFMTPWKGRFRSVERLVCNIAPVGPVSTRPLWAPAAPAASCPTRSRRDAIMTALCDYQQDLKEIIHIDASMSLEDHILLNTVLDIESNATINYLGSLDEIYLTRMAIATMENTITTQTYYNSMQRREVIEVIELLDDRANISTPVMQVVLIPLTNDTFLTAIETTTNKIAKTTSKMKISFIGRPKTYNMEDLTDFDDKTENNTPYEEIPKKEKEFYAEYEFTEPMDDNSTATLEFINTTDVITTINVSVSQDVAREVVTRLYQNSSMLYGGPINANNKNDRMNTDSLSQSDDSPENLKSTQDVENVSFIMKDNIDDYLSDPETVRELQEALDRIEHEMQPNKNSEKQGKVRRELRDFPEAHLAPKIDKSLSEELYKAELERNKTIDRGPMYNMVLKYMPYLKQYENSILSSSDDSGANKASFASPSLVLVVMICF